MVSFICCIIFLKYIWKTKSGDHGEGFTVYKLSDHEHTTELNLYAV